MIHLNTFGVEATNLQSGQGNGMGSGYGDADGWGFEWQYFGYGYFSKGLCDYQIGNGAGLGNGKFHAGVRRNMEGKGNNLSYPDQGPDSEWISCVFMAHDQQLKGSA